MAISVLAIEVKDSHKELRTMNITSELTKVLLDNSIKHLEGYEPHEMHNSRYMAETMEGIIPRGIILQYEDGHLSIDINDLTSLQAKKTLEEVLSELTM